MKFTLTKWQTIWQKVKCMVSSRNEFYVSQCVWLWWRRRRNRTDCRKHNMSKTIYFSCVKRDSESEKEKERRRVKKKLRQKNGNKWWHTKQINFTFFFFSFRSIFLSFPSLSTVYIYTEKKGVSINISIHSKH